MAGRRPFIAFLCMGMLWPLSGTSAPGPSASDRAGAEPRLAVAASVTAPGDAPAVAPWAVAATDARSVIGRAPVLEQAPHAIDAVVFNAYALAASVAPTSCRLDVSLLAAIGQVESGNLAGYRLDRRHRASPAVLGPVLDGSGGFRAIPDTDGGQLDGDLDWDRAVGPMQFLPSTWRLAGVDLDADGRRDPQDIEDAAGAAMVYLCGVGRDLGTPAGLRAAILAYNRSTAYLRFVLAWKHAYDVHGLQGATVPMLQLTAVRAPSGVRSEQVRAQATDRPRPPSPTGSPQSPATPLREPSPAPASDPSSVPTSEPAPVPSPVVRPSATDSTPAPDAPTGSPTDAGDTDAGDTDDAPADPACAEKPPGDAADELATAPDATASNATPEDVTSTDSTESAEDSGSSQPAADPALDPGSCEEEATTGAGRQRDRGRDGTH